MNSNPTVTIFFAETKMWRCALCGKRSTDETQLCAPQEAKQP